MVKQPLFLLIMAILVPVSCAQTSSVTIEKLLSAPFPSEISTALAGNKIAWIQTESGRCNLFVAEAPLFHAVQLTHYNQDDGQRLSEITWAPDQKTIIYVRG